MTENQKVNIGPWTKPRYLELPSGATIEVTGASLQMAILAGAIPQDLLSAVGKMGSTSASPDFGNDDAFKKYLEIIVKNVVKSPKIVMGEASGPDEISITCIEPDDLMAIIEYFNGNRRRGANGIFISCVPKQQETLTTVA